MTNVSKRQLSGTDYKSAYEQLLLLISNLNNKTAPTFIDELFTEAEKIMIVKRFAAAVLFNQNYTSYRVSIAIGISESTAQRLYKKYCEGEFDKLLNCLSKKQKSEFVSLIEDFILSKASPRARARFVNRVTKL